MPPSAYQQPGQKWGPKILSETGRTADFPALPVLVGTSTHRHNEFHNTPRLAVQRQLPIILGHRLDVPDHDLRLHVDRPPPGRRNKSQALITAAKLRVFTFNLLAPETMGLTATKELWRVRSLRERCNAAQESSDRKTNEPGSWLYSQTKPLVDAQGVDDIVLYAPHLEWSLPHCWVIQMGGLIFETEDEWIYYVLRDQICAFIEAGIIKCPDFTNREIQDRAKADTFAKAAGYDLPITPFEFSALAYVVCAILLYAVWWDKPQDMTVPISIGVPYTRSSLPQEIRSLTDAGCIGGWNFAFPTHAEKIAWRVFSLTALALVVAHYLIAQAPLVARWLKNKGTRLPAFMDNYSDPHGTFTKTEIFLPLWVILFYILARFGMVALIFSRSLHRRGLAGVDSTYLRDPIV
ncbi:hypothetical protein ASPCAL13470 [Aspergillus calidoustus]|uniref:Uncharacterized protein n=1 Tax=Aspergillus calidoustus TaxID=454130 RepID=A0A0U5GGT4_ASPCI|nr:hypothetical protein ASPCAL13470 [Aspergillus calidoustus]